MRLTYGIASIIAATSIAVDVLTLDANVDLDFAYSNHLTKYGLSYETVQEFSQRKQLFAASDALIRAHNAKTDRNYTLGHNKFSDWTPEEKVRLFGRETSEPLERSDPVPNDATTRAESQPGSEWTFNTDGIPDAKDWRTEGAVSPVGTQGDCSSFGGAFAVTGALEGANKIAGGNLPNLSEQQILDCGSNGEYNESCNELMETGNAFNGFTYLNSFATAIKDEDYPYTSGTSGVTGKCETTNLPQTGIKVDTWNVTPSYSGVQLRAAIAEGPTAVYLLANGFAFMHYSDGIYDSDCNDGSSIVHWMLAVGYGVQNGMNYLILRNSWGTTWGEEGYMFIENQLSGIGTCQINGRSAIPYVKSGIGSANTLAGSSFAAAIAALTWAF